MRSMVEGHARHGMPTRSRTIGPCPSTRAARRSSSPYGEDLQAITGPRETVKLARKLRSELTLPLPSSSFPRKRESSYSDATGFPLSRE